ncbi:Protein of unknown function, partial [Gryllus bimaculatus]
MRKKLIVSISVLKNYLAHSGDCRAHLYCETNKILPLEKVPVEIVYVFL